MSKVHEITVTLTDTYESFVRLAASFGSGTKGAEIFAQIRKHQDGDTVCLWGGGTGTVLSASIEQRPDPAIFYQIEKPDGTVEEFRDNAVLTMEEAPTTRGAA
jgi:hypothetical protein